MVSVAPGFAGVRPPSQEQPDQSTECELFKQQGCDHWQQHRTETVHGIEKEVHDGAPSQREPAATMAATGTG
jgi:hypothetical protein